VILSVDSVADFEELHSGKHNDEVQFYAFDALSLDGHDLRYRPLRLRNTNLARLLARGPDGISSHRSNWARSARTCFVTPANSD
jgi:bifunctional non-homologous end joining protein LigD